MSHNTEYLILKMRNACVQMEMVHLQARRELEMGAWQGDWTIPFNHAQAEFTEAEKQLVVEHDGTKKYRCVRDAKDYYCDTGEEVWDWIGKSYKPYSVHLQDGTMPNEFIPF